MNAIGIKIKKADEKHDCGASKFFGAPAIPAEWQERFSRCTPIRRWRIIMTASRMW